MLKIAIPKGSLEEGVFRLFEEANLPIRRKDRDYNLIIRDPRISEAIMLRPPEIASYISEGEFDFGITGRDWVVETKSAVVEVTDLLFSRGGWNKIKIVLATDSSNPVSNVSQIKKDAKVVTEYPRITKRYFRSLGKGKVQIRQSYGATEAKVPRLADYLVDVTETGTTLIANGKKILATILESTTLLIANQKSWSDPQKRQAMEEISSLLMGVVRAKNKVLIKMNIGQDNLKRLLEYLPAMRPPTYSPLFSSENLPWERFFMVETVVEKSNLNIIIPRIKELGATDILEMDVSKIIP